MKENGKQTPTRGVHITIPQERANEALGALRNLRAEQGTPQAGRTAAPMDELCTTVNQLGGEAQVNSISLLGASLESLDVTVREDLTNLRLITTLRRFASEVTYVTDLSSNEIVAKPQRRWRK